MTKLENISLDKLKEEIESVKWSIDYNKKRISEQELILSVLHRVEKELKELESKKEKKTEK